MKTKQEILNESQRVCQEAQAAVTEYLDSLGNADLRRIAEAAGNFDALVDLYATCKNEVTDLCAGTKEYNDKNCAIQICADWIAEKVMRDRGWRSTLVMKYIKQ